VQQKNMYISLDISYKHIQNILIECQEQRMAHTLHETLLTLVIFLILFKDAPLQLQADMQATLLLVLPVRFNLLSHLNLLISNSHKLVELKNHGHKILNEKYTTYKLQRIALYLRPNIQWLRMLSIQEQEETAAL
jgi:hypothetical protein